MYPDEVDNNNFVLIVFKFILTIVERKDKVAKMKISLISNGYSFDLNFEN